MTKCILLMIVLTSVLVFSVFLAVRPVICSSTSADADVLLGAGAKWAANGGTKVAYVDDYDNLMAHPNPMGNSALFLVKKNAVLSILQGEGFAVDTFADIPANVSQYDLLYLEAYWACTPADEPAISNYVFNGGGVVLKSGVICYLVYYSATWNTGMDLSSVASWFGASTYVNTGGNAYVSVANPFNTSLNAGDQLATGQGYSNAAITSMSADSQVLATWDDGSTFAFTHEYGQGRVYWQARETSDSEISSSPQPVSSNLPPLLTLYGGFDYGITEQAKIKIFAELRDPLTMEPISGANVTIQVFDVNDTLWVSANMVETLPGTGIYEWDSNDTVANMSLQAGVYLTRVAVTSGGLSTYDIMPFHIDPVASSGWMISLQEYSATILALVLGGTLIALAFLKRRQTPKKV